MQISYVHCEWKVYENNMNQWYFSGYEICMKIHAQVKCKVVHENLWIFA